jgi:hypothetical protein
MRSLKALRSSKVRESDLAMTGTTLTTSESFFRTTMSIGFKAWPEGWMKKRQQWMRVSWMYRSRWAVSSFRRYAECWSLIYLTIGSQHLSLFTWSPYPGVSTMFNRRRTPFSSMMCETVWISVVERTGSSGASRPFESIRCDAKIVLMRVDFPRPVCPRAQREQEHVLQRPGDLSRTDDNTHQHR